MLFNEMAVTIDNLLSKRMDAVVAQLAPTFFSGAGELSNSPANVEHDMSEYVQRTVSEAMVILLLGQKLSNPRNTEAVMAAAHAVAELGGIFQNRSWFARTWPALWRPLTWFKVVVVRVMFGLGVTMGRSIAAEMSRLLRDPETFSQKDDTSLLSLLVRRYATEDRRLRFQSKCNIYMILISAVFASVHQVASTTVWVLCELALRPDYQDEIRKEIVDLLSSNPESLDFNTLNQARLTDSFIREVMRTKGDTFSTVRMCTKDTPLGDRIVPKGYTVHPIASLAHRAPSYVGENPDEFDGRRWVKTGKIAAMTGPGHLAFGLGRWACPGRFLAVAEIKLMLFSILSQVEVELVGGKYEIYDKLMIASAPPGALFLLKGVRQ